MAWGLQPIVPVLHQQLPLQPVPHRWPEFHQQFAGRRRHLPARLGHNIEVSNNRVTNNAGTLSGGIIVGQAETPDPTLVTNPDGSVDAQPLNLDVSVSMHNNDVSLNAPTETN